MGTDCRRGDRSDHAASPPIKFEKLQAWTAEAELALADTFNGDRERIVAGVNSGRFELYKIDGGRSFMVTRIDGDILTVCCYQGADLSRDVPFVRHAARLRGLRSIDFIAKARGLGRLMRPFGARELGTIWTVDA